MKKKKVCPSFRKLIHQELLQVGYIELK